MYGEVHKVLQDKPIIIAPIVSKRSVNFSIAFGLPDLPLFEADIQYPVPNKMRELSSTFCDTTR